LNPAVAVTGIGLITPLGNTPDEVFAALMAGRSGIRLLDGPFGNTPAVAAQVDFDPAPWFNRMQLSGVDRVSQFAVAAADLARRDAGHALELAPERTGVFLGCGMGGAQSIETGYAAHFGAQRLSPLLVVAGMTHAPAAHVAMRMDVAGPALTYSVACASSTIAIGEAYRAVLRGEVDVAYAGGAEAPLAPGAVRAWQAMRTLATPDPDDPSTACRPFAIDRSGLVLGEGAAVLILERADRALARGARIYARVAGLGLSCDASHLTKPAASGQVRAMRAALACAGLDPAEVGYCNAHATATQAGDEIECQALIEVWGEHLAALAVSSTKSMHGHLLGATGALEAAITVLALHHKRIPPTTHCRNQDPGCAIPLVRDTPREAPELRAAISNSFAFGGSNAVLAFRRHDAP
jgi:3-oxoacyl-[acyl-carrier-protein] synthase II